MKKAQSFLTLLVIVVGLCVVTGSCKKKKTQEVIPETLAQVSTSPITSITDLTAIAGGALISEGSSSVIEAGICFDTLREPRIDKGVKVQSTAIGNYTCAITGLKHYTTYYVRAYATNELGTSYGTEVSFKSADNWAKQSITSSGVTSNCMKANGNKLYMGTNSGVYYSPDGGDTWQQLGLSTSTVDAIAVQGNTIVAGLKGHEIYKSVDNGLTWTKIFDAIAAPNIYDILIKDNTIYTCETSAVYVSTNMGSTWVKTKPADQVQFIRLAYCNNTIYVYGAGTIVYKSTNNGATWLTTTTLLIYDQPGYFYDFDCTENNIYITTGKGMYFSSDAGVNWNLKSDVPAYGSAISVSGNEIFSFTNASIGGFISSDNGNTWKAVTRKGLGTLSYFTDVLVCNSAFYIYVNTGNGFLYRYRR